MSDDRDHDEDPLAAARAVTVAVLASLALMFLTVVLWLGVRYGWCVL